MEKELDINVTISDKKLDKDRIYKIFCDIIRQEMRKEGIDIDEDEKKCSSTESV